MFGYAMSRNRPHRFAVFRFRHPGACLGSGAVSRLEGGGVIGMIGLEVEGLVAVHPKSPM